eukprot:724430-Amphidinium_carterae.1
MPHTPISARLELREAGRSCQPFSIHRQAMKGSQNACSYDQAAYLYLLRAGTDDSAATDGNVDSAIEEPDELLEEPDMEDLVLARATLPIRKAS